MVRTKKQLYYIGKIEELNKRLNIFIIELDKNKDIAKAIDKRFNVVWYISKIEKNNVNKKYINIAKISKGNIYINNNASIEEIIYHLMKISDVILVGKITKIKEALDIIDMGLALGKEIICIKNSGYVANKLIKDGAIYV